MFGEYVLPAYKGRWFVRDVKGRPFGACAVGRACFAAGYDPEKFWAAYGHLTGSINAKEGKVLSDFVTATWPWTADEDIWAHPLEIIEQLPRFSSWKSPECQHWNRLLCLLSDLYEINQWPMKQLAAWVATVEPKDTVPQQEEVNYAVQTAA